MSTCSYLSILSLAVLLTGATGLSARALAQQPGVAAANRSAFLGAWVLNRELTGTPPPLDVGGRRGGSRGGGFGFGGGGGGGAQSSAQDRAAARAEGERLVALIQELLTPPTRLRIALDGGQTLAFTNAEGRTTRYTPDNKSEKHQLVSGTIVTKSKWNRDELRQEINAADAIALIRTLAVDPTTNQLVVTLTRAGDRGDEDRAYRVVYDRDEN